MAYKYRSINWLKGCKITHIKRNEHFNHHLEIWGIKNRKRQKLLIVLDGSSWYDGDGNYFNTGNIK